MPEPLIYDRDDVPPWVRVCGDTGWLRELIATLRQRPDAVEYIHNLERLVADLDEMRDAMPTDIR
jgi:hypothetical protein